MERIEPNGRLTRIKEIIDQLDDLDHEQLFRAAFSICPLGIVITRVNGDIVRINNTVMVWLGYEGTAAEKEEIKKLGWKAMVHPDDRELGSEYLLDEKVISYKSRKRYLHKHGHYVWLECFVQILRYEFNPPVGFVWISPCENEKAEIWEVSCE